MYCPKCGSQNIEVSEGVNGSDYLVCECGYKANIFVEEEEEEEVVE
jgi:DNA-directed RNA polymerase subunit RPC12/RpoP